MRATRLHGSRDQYCTGRTASSSNLAPTDVRGNQKDGSGSILGESFAELLCFDVVQAGVFGETVERFALDAGKLSSEYADHGTPERVCLVFI